MIQPNSELIVDYELVRKNIQLIREKISSSSKFMAIVKSNAYGHDLDTVARALNDSVDGFGVVRLEEAMHLRAQSTLPILIMQGVYSTEAYDELKKNDFIWYDIISRKDVNMSDRIRFQYTYSSEEHIVEGLNEFHKCAVFCLSEKPQTSFRPCS